MEATTEGERQLWTLTLAPDDQHGGSLTEMACQSQGKTYTPDEIAKLRGGRILLNNPPPIQDRGDWSQDFVLESLIRGSNKPVSVDRCVVQTMWKELKDKPTLFLHLARLVAVFQLKTSNVVAEILHLSLGPISEGKLHVQFKGRRRPMYSNVDPKVIEIEGDCPLE